MAERIAIHTFGCKLNRSESDIIRQGFENRGYEITDSGDAADIIFINTCAVTGQAESKCRQFVRQVQRRHPGTRIILGGCLAQARGADLMNLPGVSMVLGGNEKFKVLEYLDTNLRGCGNVVKNSTHSNQFELEESLGYSTERTRAFVKIQDGCSYNCSFCIIPSTRGGTRSKPSSSVVRSILRLVSEGFREIVLTGVNIAQYEDPDAGNLTGLLRMLDGIPGDFRIRLGSVEPNYVDREFVETIAVSSRICPHFHLPLQSGDPEILKRMSRKYSPADYAAAACLIREALPDAGIGCDVMVGFPGESERHFMNTLTLMESIDFLYCHVFTFSPREGTPAYEMENEISSQEIKERGGILRALGHRKKQAFISRMTGKKTVVLFETEDSHGEWYGFASNYVKVCARGGNLENRLVPVTIGAAEDGVARGIPAGE